MKIAVAGATGYTGGELLRLLTQHPLAEVVCVTSERSAGKALVEQHPFLKGHYNLSLESLNPEKIADKADIVFVALAHTKAMKPVSELISAGKKVIDLSADYRLQSQDIYEKWYGLAHCEPPLLEKSVYGLPEIYRQDIVKGDLIANPGCYPTGALLPIYPFLKKGLVDTDHEIIIDAKSGVSGAGRVPGAKTHFPEANEGMKAYNIGSHRHLPEIEQEVARNASRPSKVLFAPHLLPVNRGILATIYLPLNRPLSKKQMGSVFKIYQNEPFIRIVEDPPNINNVRGSNYCDIGFFETPTRKTAILVSAIDNLVKGAAGQAIQNMNLMMGWEETTGLSAPGFFP